MEGLSVLIVNIILYIALVIYLYKRKKSRLSIFVSLIWLISASFSMLFYLISNSIWEYRSYTNLSLLPFLYIFICIFLYIYPLTKMNDRSPIYIEADRNLMTLFSLVVIILSFLPFVANLLYAITHINTSLSSFAENRGEEVELFVGPLATLNRFSKYARTFAPLLVFYFIQRPKSNKLLIFGLICAFFNPSLGNMNVGSRFLFAADLLYLLAIYLVFSNSLSKALNKKLLFFGTIVLSFFVIIFLSISFFRFTTKDSATAAMDVTRSFGLYAGEGMLNFSSNMWGLTSRTDGANTLAFVDYVFGDSPSSVRDVDKVSGAAGIPLNIFYTVVGDFYIDFGPVSDFAIFLCISILLSLLIRKNRSKYSFYTLVWICLFIRVIVIGFTYFPYMNLSMELIYVPILTIVLWIFDSRVHKKSVNT